MEPASGSTATAVMPTAVPAAAFSTTELADTLPSVTAPMLLSSLVMVPEVVTEAASLAPENCTWTVSLDSTTMSPETETETVATR